jgi:hypothetical protein
MDKDSGHDTRDGGSSPDFDVMSAEWSARVPPYGLPDDEDSEYWTELDSQTDRGAAVLAAAYLEWRIRRSINTRLIICDAHSEHIFGSDTKGGKLGFLEQSEVAYSLGLLGRTTLKDIKRICEIRNKFAHNAIVRSFDHAAVRANVDALETREVIRKRYVARTGIELKPSNPTEIPNYRRKVYIGTVHEINTAIFLAARHFAHPSLTPKLPDRYW